MSAQGAAKVGAGNFKPAQVIGYDLSGHLVGRRVADDFVNVVMSDGEAQRLPLHELGPMVQFPSVPGIAPRFEPAPERVLVRRHAPHYRQPRLMLRGRGLKRRHPIAQFVREPVVDRKRRVYHGRLPQRELDGREPDQDVERRPPDQRIGLARDALLPGECGLDQVLGKIARIHDLPAEGLRQGRLAAGRNAHHHAQGRLFKYVHDA